MVEKWTDTECERRGGFDVSKIDIRSKFRRLMFKHEYKSTMRVSTFMCDGNSMGMKLYSANKQLNTVEK